MKVQRSILEPARRNLSWHDTWEGEDQGLIACWERGRELAKQDPGLAARAREGHLIMLNWKGGVDRSLKKKQKYGTLQYLAQWQGLRGENLEIDMLTETTIACTLTGMLVTFTGDLAKYAKP